MTPERLVETLEDLRRGPEAQLRLVRPVDYGAEPEPILRDARRRGERIASTCRPSGAVAGAVAGAAIRYHDRAGLVEPGAS
jgi:hypothetical protein